MSVVDDYLKTIDTQQAKALERIRGIVAKIAPQAEEVISYGMPGFKYRGKYMLGFCAFKDHMSFFPTSIAESFKNKLADFKVSKGTIQFTVSHQIPKEIVEQIVRARLADIDGSAVG